MRGIIIIKNVLIILFFIYLLAVGFGMLISPIGGFFSKTLGLIIISMSIFFIIKYNNKSKASIDKKYNTNIQKAIFTSIESLRLVIENFMKRFNKLNLKVRIAITVAVIIVGFNMFSNNESTNVSRNGNLIIVDVENSSAITKILYDNNNNRLGVVFIQGNKLYEYCNVPQSVFLNFTKASSKGKYFHNNIKNIYNCY